ncbi:MAG: phosphoribosylamine--glycine ligase [Acidobacteriota bacterium]|nr:phosphoribosylamine--glycine ligase [Acidobacteriota bacterium]
MRILIIGSGGREHSLCWKLAQGEDKREIYCAPGNAGIAGVARCVPIEPSDTVELADFAQGISVDLTVVGPEVPLALGIVGVFKKRGLRIFGPSQKAAEIEGSKIFSKQFMLRHKIPTGEFQVFESDAQALKYIKSKETIFPVVIKADGLAAGKGVIIAKDRKQAQKAIELMMVEKKFGSAGQRVIVEEFLQGRETSFFVLSDGSRVLPMVTCQDHKRALDEDKGPNTGGMGAYSPAMLNQEMFKQILNDVMIPTISGLAEEGRSYRGVLYAGIMLTDKGPKALEFNARFGDPECQVLMPRLKGDLAPVLHAAAEGRLDRVKLDWRREAAACVVLASGGYPEKSETGKTISGLNSKFAGPVIVFHAATRKNDGGQYITSGGRVLNVVALGADLTQAVERAYAAASQIRFEGMQYRSDIGREAVAVLKGGARG